jgi:putative methanogen marker protein 4
VISNRRCINGKDMSDIIERIYNKALENHARVALGIGSISPGLLQSAAAAEEFAEVVLVGNSQMIKKTGTGLEVIHSDQPSKTLIDLLDSHEVDAAVRGTLSATSTLTYLKQVTGQNNLFRISLLETPDKIAFFFAPVGIDEGVTREGKLEFIRRGVKHIRRFGIEPRVAVLSGGRLEDRGRNLVVDKTMDDAEYVAKKARAQGYDARHFGILIEDAIKDADFILAPDGISGNLIYRTMVLVAGGYGYGAPVLMDKVFVDTSRVAGNYTRAIMMACALVK